MIAIENEAREKAKAGLGESGRKRKKEANCIDDHVGTRKEREREREENHIASMVHWRRWYIEASKRDEEHPTPAAAAEDSA